jgi:SpoVK/Ycf46/Vps4 family AAA+-type ATPase
MYAYLTQVGESEKAIARVFEDARNQQPAVIFIDEFESLFGHREKTDIGLKVYAQLVYEIHGVRTRGDRVVVLAITNHIDSIEPGLLCAGRIDTHIHVPLPSLQDRKLIIQGRIRKVSVDSEVDFDELAAKTEGMNCSQVCEIVRRGCLFAVESSQALKNSHFELMD